ncbi:MAG: hypothetical protein JO360_08810 [Acidobacteria bacterium]|nr:hypothetical protein [Acidobacteriota bacterium]
MRRRLSSLHTFPNKFIFPPLWLAIFGGFTVMMFLGTVKADETSRWIVLCAVIVGAVILYWTCLRLKAVSVDDKYLYVSNYLKEVSVPLTEVVDVTESMWLSTHPVTVHLRAPCEFGAQIYFMPPFRMFAFLKPHPVTEELRELVAASRNRAAGWSS